MPGALLRSGEAREFQALGADGQPVYSAALPLRETIRLKLGADAANCLALVQPSESGEHFDWYAPFEGDVIPWASATDEEHRDALAKLETLHRDLLATAERMQADAANREKQIFARLLRKAVHFPSSEHVYLVDGKPVVTFWGFAAQGADTPNPLLYLRPPPVPVIPPATKVAPPAAAPLVVKKFRWRWLWLLPLLLLLLLLLFLLRACAPQVPLPFGLNELDLPGLPAVGLEQGLPERDWSIDVNGHGAGGTGLPAREDMPEMEQEGAADMPLPTGEDLLEELPMGQEEPTPEQTTPEELAQDPSEQNQSSFDVPSEQQQGTPIDIPPEALQNGSTDFLNGKWAVTSGIQDKNTGKPLRLNYEFKDGKGEVQIARDDGVTCRGPVAAGMQGGKLSVGGRQARCSNGEIYDLPTVECQQGDMGADCEGQADTERFPMSMRKNENGK